MSKTDSSEDAQHREAPPHTGTQKMRMIGLVLAAAAAAGAWFLVDATLAQDLTLGLFSQARPVDVHGAREALKESLEQKIIAAYDGDVVENDYTA